MSIEPELQAASDTMLANLDRLRALEIEKRQLPLGDPRIVQLAEEIERLAATVLGATDTQTDLAKEALDEARTGTLDPTTTIEELSNAPREVHAVLAEWREAERQLSEAPLDSTEALRLRTEIELLRDEYRRAHEVAVRRASQSE